MTQLELESRSHRRAGRMVAVFAAATLACSASALHASDYPAQPVRMLVPFAAGGSTDVAARIIGARLSEVLGQPVVVENRPGGGTVVATREVTLADADGYTLLYAANSISSNPALRELPYDTLNDLVPIAQTVAQPFLFVVHPSMPATTVEEFIAHAHAHPGEINFGTAGTGTGNHLAQEFFAILSETELQHVPYQGDGPMVVDLLAGRMHMTISTAASLLPYVQSGDLRPLGVGSAERMPQLPDVPTIAESGLPDYVVGAWNMVFAPAGTDPAVIATLSDALGETLADPAVAEALVSAGALPAYSTPEDARAFLVEEMATWANVIESRNIVIE